MPSQRVLLFTLVAFSIVVSSCASHRAESEIGVALAAESTHAPEEVHAATVPPVTTEGPVEVSNDGPRESSSRSDNVDDRGSRAEVPSGTLVATAFEHVEALVAYDAAGKEIALPFLVPNPHQFGGPLTLMVVSGQPGDQWVEVMLPVRPNGQTAWVRTADYSISETRIRAEVDLAQRVVRVFDGDELVVESPAVVGNPSTPTPLGTFFIAAKRANPESEPYLGPHALVLSGFSEALETFSGGLPVIAIHGTNRPEQVGEAITNGCVRIPNDIIDLLNEHVPLGAPVEIHA